MVHLNIEPEGVPKVRFGKRLALGVGVGLSPHASVIAVGFYLLVRFVMVLFAAVIGAAIVGVTLAVLALSAVVCGLAFAVDTALQALPGYRGHRRRQGGLKWPGRLWEFVTFRSSARPRVAQRRPQIAPASTAINGPTLAFYSGLRRVCGSYNGRKPEDIVPALEAVFVTAYPTAAPPARHEWLRIAQAISEGRGEAALDAEISGRDSR